MFVQKAFNVGLFSGGFIIERSFAFHKSGFIFGRDVYCGFPSSTKTNIPCGVLWIIIRDYEQWSRGRTSVCACVYEREFEGWLVLLELLTLVASRNTTSPNSNSTRIEDPYENQRRLMWLPLLKLYRFFYMPVGLFFRILYCLTVSWIKRFSKGTNCW